MSECILTDEEVGDNYRNIDIVVSAIATVRGCHEAFDDLCSRLRDRPGCIDTAIEMLVVTKADIASGNEPRYGTYGASIRDVERAIDLIKECDRAIRRNPSMSKMECLQP